MKPIYIVKMGPMYWDSVGWTLLQKQAQRLSRDGCAEVLSTYEGSRRVRLKERHTNARGADFATAINNSKARVAS